MAWRMETGRRDGKKGRGERRCSSDDTKEAEERKGREGKKRERGPRSQGYPLRRYSLHWPNVPSLGFRFQWITTS